MILEKRRHWVNNDCDGPQKGAASHLRLGLAPLFSQEHQEGGVTVSTDGWRLILHVEVSVVS